MGVNPSLPFVRKIQMVLLLHSQNHRGEILLFSLRRLCRINLESHLCGGHLRTDLDREFENQPEILVHESYRKLWAIVARHRSLQFSNVGGSDDGSLGQHLEQTIAIETRLLTQCHGLRNRLHADSQEGVHDKLHRRAGTARPQIKMLSGDGLKDRLGGVEAIPVASSE